MADYYLDLTGFPAFLHRIVKSWYVWQEISLRSRGRFPGEITREPRAHETREQIYWGGRPPEMINSQELAFINEGDVSFYLVCRDGKFFIDSEERGSRDTYWMFRRFDDAEKYLLFLLSQMARPGQYTKSPSYSWYQEGVDPRVTLSKPDPVNFPGRVSLRVDQEATDRGWMGESDAPAGSHVIVLSFAELDSILRQGIPADWFTVNIRTE
ncbi:hypothetical protein JF732_11850 [Mycobacterium intracellulare]|uniref:Uncharacterized protein n=1 Tax=Mycobacterium intracellulare TaxID=1767 RepID=A0AAE4REE0_MYCIT|nr:hypothetical protein [Mycobacterium intracellulare]MCA2320807.1 hypothetical protein [Mycobacterium intracellulare]MCA2341241.1 hypothetical protein [Mycobacterium intracellulare]MDV6976040.1 hypothetical protein [Mycobacterium intracellulare]MDV6980794.1 hypothetical protein [Mycobacterium intracellulare]MDV7012564.1 hypothetical protein [Mycobacterium intracellulare]